MSTNPETACFWAKTSPDGGYHPLVAHSADVAAVMYALTEPGTALFDRLIRAAGADWDAEALRSTLVYLSALHDLGKVNHGFQDKDGPWARPDRARTWPARGHVIPVIASMNTQGEFLSVMATLVRRLPFLPNDPTSSSDAILTTIAHHGRPWVSDPRRRAGPLWEKSWAPDPETGRDPMREIKRLGHYAASWSGIEAVTTSLSWSAALSNLFAGLLTVADWIGSTERIFRPSPEADDAPEHYWEEARERAAVAVRQIGVRPSEVIPVSAAEVYSRLFPSLFPRHDPTPLQRLVAEITLPAPGDRLVIESETGSGKTEAALALYTRLRSGGRVDGLVFALPTRATAQAMHDRVSGALPALHPDGAMPTLALAMGGEVNHAEGEETKALDHPYPDDERMLHRWASDHHKSFFAAEIVVGTVDQILLAGLPVRHAHMRLALLTRHLVVIDEVHSYDRYMNAVLNRVLDYHSELGGVSAFLSATLSREARNRLIGVEVDVNWAEAAEAPYPSLSIHDGSKGGWTQTEAETTARPKTVRWSVVSQEVRERAVFDEAVRIAQDGGRVCVLRNTVKDARATVEALEVVAPNCLWRPAGSDQTPAYHSRYILGDRLHLDRAALTDFGKGSTRCGVILVATQVIEQSLDVDFDWMMTDLAPVDVLLQRIGRLHRHERSGRPVKIASARLQVQAPEKPFPPRAESRGHFGWGTVYGDWGDLELTRRLIVDRPEIVIPRDNRLLVEGVYHPDARNALVRELPEWQKAMTAGEGRRLGLDTAGAMGALALERSYPDQARQYDQTDGERIRTRIGDDRISVSLDRPVFGWYARSASSSDVSLRLDRLLKAGGVDLSDPTASFERESECGPIYRVGDKLRLRYGPEGWVRLAT